MAIPNKAAKNMDKKKERIILRCKEMVNV